MECHKNSCNQNYWLFVWRPSFSLLYWGDRSAHPPTKHRALTDHRKWIRRKFSKNFYCHYVMLERNSLAGALNTQFSQPISLKLLSTGKKTFAIDENLEDRFTTHFLNSSLLTSNSRPKEMIFLESRRSLNLRLKMHYMKYVLILFFKKS